MLAEWTPLQHTWAIVYKDADEESNIYEAKWMVFLLFVWVKQEVDNKKQIAKYLTVVDRPERPF